MTTTYENILVDRVDGGVGIVTLNRPRVLNALNFGLVSELDAVLTDFENDADIRAVVITGAGEKAFSAGADIHENVDGRLARHPAGARRPTMFIAAHSDGGPDAVPSGREERCFSKGKLHPSDDHRSHSAASTLGSPRSLISTKPAWTRLAG